MTDLKTAMKQAKEMAEAQGIDYDNRKYLPVKDRLTIFREAFGMEYGIDTDVQFQDGIVMASAKITKDGIPIASGHAMVDTAMDPHSAPVESCETFAIGRALACLGLAGSEYASANEMERVKPPRPQRPEPQFREDSPSPRLAKDRVMAHGPNDGLSGDQRQFKRDVEDAFPSVGKMDFFVPEDNSPGSLNGIYDQLDRIDNLNDLSAYYNVVSHNLEWMGPEDKQEISASFKARRAQLKG